MKKGQEKNAAEQMPDKDANDYLSEYPVYPASEDIYNKYTKEEDIDPEDISRVKKADQSDNTPAIMGEESDDGLNLDVPGSELDDKQEIVGNEDEENNYYSIGGDNHNNLDEDKDELM